MEVKLLAATTKPLETMYIAARTCYSEDGPIQLENNLPNDDIKWELIEKVLKSGHQSIAEHISFTFAIEDISRACSHQLVRHRHCTFSQKSQRYVKIEEDLSLLAQTHINKESYNKIVNVLDKYFIWNKENLDDYFYLSECLYLYLKKMQEGMPAEEVRNILPNCTKTNLVMTCNLRELIHICNLRLCNRAQLEIRQLAKLLSETVYNNYSKRLIEFLVPTCEMTGYCKEAKSCGRKPKKE